VEQDILAIRYVNFSHAFLKSSKQITLRLIRASTRWLFVIRQ
jgi:hypothetical protein